jgi:hypothetical protein
MRDRVLCPPINPSISGFVSIPFAANGAGAPKPAYVESHERKSVELQAENKL